MKTFLMLVMTCTSTLAAAADFSPGYYVQIGRSYDAIMPFDQISIAAPELALRIMRNLEVVSIGVSTDDRADQKLQARQLLAQNPNLPGAVNAALKRIPDLIETSHERQALIDGLARLPAEWAVNQLVALSQQEMVLRSEVFDFDNEAHMRKLALDYQSSLVDRTNAGLSIAALKRIELPGWLDTLNSQVPERLIPESSHESARNNFMRAARWIELNQHRVPEMVMQKWGQKAIMNADIGLDPDNLALAPNGRPPTRVREPRRPARAIGISEPMDDSTSRSLSGPIAGIALVIASAAWYLRQRWLKRIA